MSNQREIKQAAVRLLARRAYSRHQLFTRLQRRHPADDVNHVLDQLEGLGLLDDNEVATARAHYGRFQKLWGENRIRADLKRLGIDATIVDCVLGQLQLQKSESDCLQQLVEEWVRQRGRPARIQDAKRLYDHCIRRGYSASEVRRVLEPFWSGLEWGS